MLNIFLRIFFTKITSLHEKKKGIVSENFAKPIIAKEDVILAWNPIKTKLLVLFLWKLLLEGMINNDIMKKITFSR